MTHQATIYTVGHSNKDFGSFLSLITFQKIETVIDCRTRPRSRWSHFNRGSLEQKLTLAGIAYEFRGNNLGGYGDNTDYDETIQELANRARKGERIALMCSEGKPSDCHRSILLAPSLEAHGISVEHLLYDTLNMRLL